MGLSNHYFDSVDVKVFPCSYRGSYTDNGNVIAYNPEARLPSEYNLTHLSDAGHSSYLIGFDDVNNILTCVIGGYRFEINTTKSEIGTQKLFIDLRTINGGGFTTQILDAVNVSTVDGIIDKDGKFLGIYVDSTNSLNLEHFLQPFVLDGSNNIVENLAAKLPEIQTGSAEHSAGVGTGLTIDRQNSFVTGTYNQTNQSTLFAVGNGTASNATSNAFEVRSDGISLNCDTQVNRDICCEYDVTICGDTTIGGTLNIYSDTQVHYSDFSVGNDSSTVFYVDNCGSVVINGSLNVSQYNNSNFLTYTECGGLEIGDVFDNQRYTNARITRHGEINGKYLSIDNNVHLNAAGQCGQTIVHGDFICENEDAYNYPHSATFNGLTYFNNITTFSENVYFTAGSGCGCVEIAGALFVNTDNIDSNGASSHATIIKGPITAYSNIQQVNKWAWNELAATEVYNDFNLRTNNGSLLNITACGQGYASLYTYNTYINYGENLVVGYENPIQSNGASRLSTALFDLIYPVGSLYISVKPENPGLLFGIGTWHRLSGGSLWGVNNSINYMSTTTPDPAIAPQVIGDFITRHADAAGGGGGTVTNAHGCFGVTYSTSSTIERLDGNADQGYPQIVEFNSEWTGIGANRTQTIYKGTDNTLRPTAFNVHIWVRDS